eukprot:scaffold43746_cov51-Phaeocystis_antarctica.AAC.1
MQRLTSEEAPPKRLRPLATSTTICEMRHHVACATWATPSSFFTAYAVFLSRHLARQTSPLNPVQLAVGALLPLTSPAYFSQRGFRRTERPPMALTGGSLHSTCVVRGCGAYFSLDAAPFSRCSRPFSPVCCLPPLRIFCKFGPESGKFMKEIWGASNGNSGRGQCEVGRGLDGQVERRGGGLALALGRDEAAAAGAALDHVEQ